jgi:hypothetical protein
MPATQPHVDSGVSNPAAAEPTMDRHASRPARSHKTLDLNALQRSPAPATPRSSSTMSHVLNETRAWKSQESYSFKRDRDAKRASSGYAVRAKSAPRSRLPNPGVLQHDQLRAALYLHGDSSYESLKGLQTRNSDTALRASVGRVVTRMSLPSEGSPDGSFPDPSIDYHQVFESAADRVSDNLIHFLQPRRS